ncbi:hypothetical protein [Bosea sp. (in: a-proteobacteria)]|uniref:hypothetical protein n=1 Tax=Bosea sp. (in: a-proteobacteria) TaxID=1871050 RepID=UPI001ACFE554|nr:hypothetical protein [Bosea sp. (in: a-proteobacteria)]MBN9438242.1 hypothetical protein [Bosea sp. (in: a-proteobacteria)]
MEPTEAKALRVNEASGRSVLSIPKVRKFLDLMVEGDKLKDAAIAAGLRVNRARRLMSDPAVRKAFFREIEVLSESNRARNILLRETLRDRGLEPDAPAALAKVALEAARQLDGDDSQGGITINGGQNVIAGYVIRLPAQVEGPRAITNRSADDAKALISREGVTDVDG